jgi:UDP-N-acetylmuramyl pentapeptide phosphotransferase/UDP-N-acetylglucosamine-1-phosphate transferase
MSYLYTFIAFITSMVLAMLVIPRILVIAVKHSLYDIPNERKMHKSAIPRIGGVSFVPCILFAMMFAFSISNLYPGVAESHHHYPNNSEFYLFFCGLTLLYLGGVKDDLVGLRYRHKFTIQAISSLLIIFSGLYINNFYGFLGIHQLTPWIGVPLTVFVIVFITNAINLIDGMDGLASGLSIFALCIYGTLFLLHDSWPYAILAFSTVGVLIPFFYYNVFGNEKKGRKLFMGDSGSLTLGFILGFLAICYACSRPDAIRPIGNMLVIAVSPLLIPMLDVIRVILVRIKKRKHLFKADCSHIHHKLIRMEMKKMTALIVLFVINIGFCIINFALMNYLNNTFIFLIDIILWMTLNAYFSYKVKKKQRSASEITETKPVRSSETAIDMQANKKSGKDNERVCAD